LGGIYTDIPPHRYGPVGDTISNAGPTNLRRVSCRRSAEACMQRIAFSY